MILVTGATGNAGSQVVAALVDGGHKVRSFAREPDRAERLLGPAVEIAVGDFADRESVRSALEGVQAVFLSGADDPRRVDWETGAIDAAAEAGVQRIVKLSSIEAAPGAPVAFWDWHGQVEEHLRASGVPAVVLRSSYFMTNLFAAAEQIAREGRWYAPAGTARIAMIDPRDIGATAAAVLTGADHDGRDYVLTGPEAITHAQAAAALSAATAREIEYVDVPDEGAKQAMIHAGLPAVIASGIVEIYAALRQGAGEQVTGTVESLTGSPPRDFAAFARDHARAFAPMAVGAGR